MSKDSIKKYNMIKKFLTCAIKVHKSVYKFLKS